MKGNCFINMTYFFVKFTTKNFTKMYDDWVDIISEWVRNLIFMTRIATMPQNPSLHFTLPQLKKNLSTFQSKINGEILKQKNIWSID